MAIIQDNPENLTERDTALQHYAEVDTPKIYLQVDGWVNPDGQIDEAVNPDGSRLSLTAGATKELWRGDYALRIHINPETTPEDVIALLKQATEWLETDKSILALTHYLGTHQPAEPPEWMPLDESEKF